MTADSNTRHSTGISRRAVTRTAAWSVPAVTVAVAAPTLAASGNVDLKLEGLPMGSALRGFSPDRLQMYDILLVAGYNAFNVGDVTTPAGSTVTLSFDSRVMSLDSFEVNKEPATQMGTRTDGNVTTVSYRLPLEIPAGGLIGLDPDFTYETPAPWFSDVEPYTITITPPEGTTDANNGNNSAGAAVRYAPTVDASVAVSWERHNLYTSSGDALPINIPKSVRVEAMSPGDVEPGAVMYVNDPSTVESGGAEASAFDHVRIVSAELNGQDVKDQIVAESWGGASQHPFTVDVLIPEGQVLTVVFDIDLVTSPREDVTWPAAVSFFGGPGDRDEDNNEASAELIE